jgi:hypothetical protein
MLRRNQTSGRVLFALLAGGMAVAAKANPFFVDAYGGFISGTAVGGAGVTYVNDADTATGGAFAVGADADGRSGIGVTADIIWGTPIGVAGPYSGRSGFALSRVQDQLLEADAVAVPVGRLFHFNEPIGSGTGLLSTDMEWTIALFANLTDAANAEATSNAGVVYSTTGIFTIYNWETTNAGYGPGGFRFFNGSTWVPNVGAGGDECPNDLPVGTLTTPNTGPGDPAATEIFISDGNPTGATICPDANIYTPKSFPSASFDFGDSTYQLQISGFFNELGTLTDTFWACEDENCFGEIRLSLRNVSATPVPTLSTYGLLIAMLAVLTIGGLNLHRRKVTIMA